MARTHDIKTLIAEFEDSKGLIRNLKLINPQTGIDPGKVNSYMSTSDTI